MITTIAICSFPFMMLTACYFVFKNEKAKSIRRKQAKLRSQCKVERTQGDSIAKEWHKNKGVIDEVAEFDELINDQEFMQELEEELK